MAVEKPPKIAIVPGGSKSSVTFVIQDEDHTLGNSLRYILMRHKDVVFAGYSMPHPSEPKINIRVQTRDGVSAEDVFRECVRTLDSVWAHMGNVFVAATQRGAELASAAPSADAATAAADAAEVPMDEDAAPRSRRKHK